MSSRFESGGGALCTVNCKQRKNLMVHSVSCRHIIFYNPPIVLCILVNMFFFFICIQNSIKLKNCMFDVFK